MAPPRGLGPWWVVFVGVAVSLVLIADDHVLRGGVVLSLFLGLGAVLRALLPSSRAGGLAVRSRIFDTTALLTLSIACLILAALLKPK